MTPLPGFTSNPLRTRSDLLQAALALIAPLDHHKSPAKARVRFPFQHGAGFDEVAAQLEGFARPLFAVAPLLMNYGGDSSQERPPWLSSWIEGIAAGVDPRSPEYWGEIGDVDQRMVETESIAFALLLGPEVFLHGINDTVKENLVCWLKGIRSKRMPANNWRWFRVFVNLALVKALGVGKDEVRDEIESDFAVLDSFYLGEGWSSDGVWGEERSQADYYSGSFAIQFSQLLFVRFAEESEYRDRVQRYRCQAREFAAKFWKFFDLNGAAIPFGRSMTYRFAFAAFWAAAALAKVELDHPLSPGVVKGLLLRHLRWWADEARASMFHADGTMTVGFVYPNMYLAEDYNSPQSPYWCLKSFIVLALPETDEFWVVEEEDYPISSLWPGETSSSAPKATVVWPPKQIVVNDPFHHYLLSSGQSTTKAFKGREAKYGKFAYSSAFGFSVPTGPLLHQTAPDNTLAIRFNHDDLWKTRSSPEMVRLEEISLGGNGGGQIIGLTSTWKPASHLRHFEIETTLIPPLESLPGWHLRIHRVSAASSGDGVENITIVDGGFAIASCAPNGRFVPELDKSEPCTFGWFDSSSEPSRDALVSSWAGVSGVVDLTNDLGELSSARGRLNFNSATGVMRADPNTSLMTSRTMIPFIQHNLSFSGFTSSTIFVSAVFAATTSKYMSNVQVSELWGRRPSIKIDHRGGLEVSVSTL